MEKEEGVNRFEEVFLLYLLKSKRLLLAKKKSIIQQLKRVMREEIEAREWQIDEEKRRTYFEIGVSFYEESLWDIEFLVKRKRQDGTFSIKSEQLEALYRFEKVHLGYSFEEESKNVSDDIRRLIGEDTTADQASDFLLKKYAMITTATLLQLKETLVPNHLPDYALAVVKRKIVDDYFAEKSGKP